MATSTKKVWLYSRVATLNNAEQRLAEQKDLLTQYCQEKGYEILGHTWVEGPAKLVVKTLRWTEEQEGVDLLLAVSPAKLTRVYSDFLAIQKRLADKGIGLEFVKGPVLDRAQEGQAQQGNSIRSQASKAPTQCEAEELSKKMKM